eukprot:c11729_g1_i1.p1 GENE.c11729_g1_i1~~c11729_g1_i1.p1  ORF type:complete len:588 (-),score=117.07 c11729_g1_i1:153-1916(-)
MDLLDEHTGLVSPASSPSQRLVSRLKIIWFVIGLSFGVLAMWSMQLAGDLAQHQDSQPNVLSQISQSQTRRVPVPAVPENSKHSSSQNEDFVLVHPSASASPSDTASASASQSASPSATPSSATPVPTPPKKLHIIVPCERKACDVATSEEACLSTCDCIWKPERPFCYGAYSGRRLLIGPQDPRPVHPVWDGTYEENDFPRPLPPRFAGEPAPEAKGKFAYVTMLSPIVAGHKDAHRYSCLGLSLFTSIRHTNPHPDIDLVIVILISDDDNRLAGKTVTEDMAPELLGKFYNAFLKVGVKRFVVWRELDTSRTIASGTWKQAFSKLQMWTLVQYEKIIFLDADKLVFRNMDHLFEIDSDFATPGDWNCRNAGASLFPAGGFWVLRPSLKTYGVISDYLEGPDPCGEKWYQGDQVLPRLLYTDITEVMSRHNSLSPLSHGDQIARWDGDVGMMLGNDINRRIGRCGSYVGYGSHPTHRIDAVVPVDRTKEPYIPPKSTWVMLNMSYDMTVGVCAEGAFISQDNRFEIGTGGWAKVNPFSVHMSCFEDKPACQFDQKLMDMAPPCLQEIFTRYYEYLKEYDMNDLLSG